jgi:glycerophosphoryl diester phosphodiesterase
VIVVSHDPILEPAICTGPKLPALIHELTLAQLKQYDCGALRNPLFPKQQPVPGTRVPTLDEVFALAARSHVEFSHVEFNIETKIFRDHPEYTPSPEKFCELVLAIVRKYKLESRVMLQSFDFRTLHAMEKLAPRIRRVALYEGTPKGFVEIGREAHASIVSPRYTLVTKEQVDAAHKAGLQVVPWTPNKPEEWQALIDAGVDAIITDDPAALISYLKKARA